MRMTLGLAVLALCFWGSAAIIAARHGLYIRPPIPWLAALLDMVAPWGSLIGGFILWRKSRLWRRLHARRHQPLPLARSPQHQPPPQARPSPLERAATVSMAVGGIALIYALGLARPGQVLAAGVLTGWFVRSSLQVLRRR